MGGGLHQLAEHVGDDGRTVRAVGRIPAGRFVQFLSLLPGSCQVPKRGEQSSHSLGVTALLTHFQADS